MTTPGGPVPQRGGICAEGGCESRKIARRHGALVPDGLSMDDLARQLQSGVIGGPFLYYEEVTSTNTEARSLAANGASEGTVVIAEHQTAGRGRLGRQWSSPAGQGLLFSVVLRPTLPTSDVHLLTLVVASAAARAMETMAGVRVDIKWPNDLFIGGRKVGGILIDAGGAQDAVGWVVAGIGINVNTELRELPAPLSRTAGSLKAAGGVALDRTQLLAQLLLQIEVEYITALASGFDGALNGFRKRDCLLGRNVRIQTKDGPVLGLAAGISESGALLVQLSKDKVRCFHFGDVTLRI